MAFYSKIEQMERLIGSFDPVAATLTHILLDSWYGAKCLWRAAREHDFLITTGMKSNRFLRVADESTPEGWRWLSASDYVAALGEHDYVQMSWPRGGKPVYVHVVSTQVRKLYRCQLVIVRQSPDGPPVADALLGQKSIWRLAQHNCLRIWPPLGH